MFVKDRDFLQIRKIWNEFPTKDSLILHFKSATHPNIPETDKFIRAHTVISAYYIHTVSYNPPVTQMSIITQTDIRGSIPTWLVNKVAQKAPKDWVNSLIKGCQIATGKIK